MAKKGLCKFVAFAAVAGAVAAGISYFTKYKSFHDELEEDFHDFEGEEEKDDTSSADSTMNRNYVPIKDGEPKADEGEESKAEANPVDSENDSESTEAPKTEPDSSADGNESPKAAQETPAPATTIEDDITE